MCDVVMFPLLLLRAKSGNDSSKRFVLYAYEKLVAVELNDITLNVGVNTTNTEETRIFRFNKH